MVVRMRHTRSQTRQRRSHHALTESSLSTCTNCGAFHLPHHMCLACGFYKGRQVMDLASQKAQRNQRLKAKKDLISAEGSVAPQPVAEQVTEEVKPKAKARAAKGAAAKRLKDESASQHSTGTE